MCEEDEVGSMSVKHSLIVSNSEWTWQPFAVFATLYTLMGPKGSSPAPEHGVRDPKAALLNSL